MQKDFSDHALFLDLNEKFSQSDVIYQKKDLVSFENTVNNLLTNGPSFDPFARLDYKNGKFSYFLFKKDSNFVYDRLQWLQFFLNSNLSCLENKEKPFSFYITIHDTASLPEFLLEKVDIKKLPFIMIDMEKAFFNAYGKDIALFPDRPFNTEVQLR